MARIYDCPIRVRWGEGLFELRPKGPEGIGRVFYCTQVGRRIVVLHSFTKKT
ncbi:type II toxin-antitoxin system RelE/ParE family toxin [Mycetohabitans endofungorum]|uniref:type II toxin-antitoxin system RelE/ParE family toxin n=1 Tax=Mycetohabitans endofungorum TaxID=417203 RepID=UPI00396A6D96